MVSVQSSQAGSGRIAGFCAKKAFASHLLLVHEGEHFRSGFPAQETTSKPAVPREQEAVQTLHCPMENRELGEKKARVAS